MIKLTQPVKGKLIYAPDGIIGQKFGECIGDTCNLYKSMGLKGHNGIDFRGKRGTPVYAAHSGKVIYAQEFHSITGKGIKILDETKTFATLYCHCDELLVSAGESVSEGQIIAKMGNSGSDYFYMAVHLHFGLYETDKNGVTINTNNGYNGAIDPLPYFAAEKFMDYIIVGTEQYLYYQSLNIAFNIGDPTELGKLQLQGLSGEPIKKDKLPDKCLVYPLISKDRLKDLFGL